MNKLDAALGITASLILIASLLMSSCTTTNRATPKPNPAMEGPAESAAWAWLRLLDEGKIRGSWQTASKPLKQEYSVNSWVGKVGLMRGPIGSSIRNRQLIATMYQREIPGLPEADYVLASYSTATETLTNCFESVSMILEEDGRWRTRGYQVARGQLYPPIKTNTPSAK